MEMRIKERIGRLGTMEGGRKRMEWTEEGKRWEKMNKKRATFSWIEGKLIEGRERQGKKKADGREENRMQGESRGEGGEGKGKVKEGEGSARDKVEESRDGKVRG